MVAGQPAFDVKDPNLRFIDLDGDGKADLLLSDMECFLWQVSLGKDGFGAVHRIAKMLDERMGPRCIFEETIQTIFLADRSSYGRTHIARLRDGNHAFGPNRRYLTLAPTVTVS